MQIEKLENIIEAILFASGNGIAISELTDRLELQKSEVNRAISTLKVKYGGDSGVRLLTYGGKIQFGTNPAYADSVTQVLSQIKEKELSAAALETIAIIAYRQPVTRLEIEQIRGVNCDYAVQVLLKHNMIEAVGRKDVVGKPILFGTTEDFLKRFQISGLSELPDYEQLLENIKVLNEKRAAPIEAKGLYNEFEIPEDAHANIDKADAEVAASLDLPTDFAETEYSGTSENKAKKTETLDNDTKKVLPDDEFPEEEIPDFLVSEKDLQKIE